MSFWRNPVDRIKIAQEFMVDLEEGSSNAAIVRAAIALAAALKLDVIVEGVETAEQLALIKSMGARHVQGYYYSEPLQAKDITEILGNSTIFPVRPAAFVEADMI